MIKHGAHRPAGDAHNELADSWHAGDIVKWARLRCTKSRASYVDRLVSSHARHFISRGSACSGTVDGKMPARRHVVCCWRGMRAGKACRRIDDYAIGVNGRIQRMPSMSVTPEAFTLVGIVINDSTAAALISHQSLGDEIGMSGTDASRRWASRALRQLLFYSSSPTPMATLKFRHGRRRRKCFIHFTSNKPINKQCAGQCVTVAP